MATFGLSVVVVVLVWASKAFGGHMVMGGLSFNLVLVAAMAAVFTRKRTFPRALMLTVAAAIFASFWVIGTAFVTQHWPIVALQNIAALVIVTTLARNLTADIDVKAKDHSLAAQYDVLVEENMCRCGVYVAPWAVLLLNTSDTPHIVFAGFAAAAMVLLAWVPIGTIMAADVQ